jgi:tetratricopeptide (TPR) repeat protein
MRPGRQLFASLLLALAASSASLPPAASAQRVRNPHSAHVNTRELDQRIARAEAKLSAANATDADRAAAADAYLARGNVYFAAGTPSLYRFALGDFRRALGYRPTLSEAREKAEQITRIYESMGRPVPTNGDEPSERLEEMLAKAERLNFAGEPAAAGASGEITRGAVRDYVVTIPAGRRVRVLLTPAEGPARNPVWFNFYEARDGAAVRLVLGTSEWSGDLERASDYLVRIGPLTHGARYRLEVTHDKVAETRKF